MAKRHRKTHTLLADVPVDRPGDDQLGRLPFARTLAKTMKSMKGPDSFVFGLCGPWGSGKSSILRLIEHELSSGSSKNKPVVCNFNPWWFSGQDQLLHAFLCQLGVTVGRVDSGTRVSGLGEKLSVLGKILRPFGLIPGAHILREAADAMAAGADAAKSIGTQLSQDVFAIRQAIDELLRESEERIIVVMDDIDRLTADEIAQLFLIVKAVADFSNTVYLLAFDHAVVSNAITTALRLDGASYLEKIVQVQIDIPPCSPVRLQQLFLSQLQDLLNDDEITEKSNQDFGNLFHDGLKEFFRTPRSVKRLTNVLRVLLPSIQGEVYWPDFVAIISLMTFAPEAYRSIRDSGPNFCGLDYRPDDGSQAEAKKFHERWLHRCPDEQRQAVSQIVQRLFPKVESALDGPAYGPGFATEWRAQLRVCAPECFDRYFQLQVPEGEFTEADWRDVVQMLDEPKKLAALIGECCKTSGPHGLSSRAKAFVERASLFAKHRATPEQAKKLFQGIVRSGDLMISIKDTDRINLIPIDNELRLIWLMQDCLKPVGDPAERDRFVEESLSEAGLRTAVEFLGFFGAQHGKYGHDPSSRPGPPILSLPCVERLEAALLDRIRDAAADGSLEKDPQFTSIVFHWERFGGADEAKHWIQRVTSTDAGFVQLAEQLTSFGVVHGMNDRVATRIPTFASEILVDWLHGVEARKRAQALLDAPPARLKPEQTQSLRLLVNAIAPDGSPVDLMRPGKSRTRTDEKKRAEDEKEVDAST
jgi:predicted KAP-like P-loop ATPase